MQQEPELSFEARLPQLICTAKPVDKHEGNDDLPTNPSRLPIPYRAYKTRFRHTPTKFLQ
jgi:hypothetical protein